MKDQSKEKKETWILKAPDGSYAGEHHSYREALKAGYLMYGLDPFKVEQDPPKVVTIATPFFGH